MTDAFDLTRQARERLQFSRDIVLGVRRQSVSLAASEVNQARWEGECSRRGEAARLEKEAHEDRIDGKLADQVLAKLAPHIEHLQAEGLDIIKGGGRSDPWAWPIQDLGARELALLTLKAALRCEGMEGVEGVAPLTMLARKLAAFIRDEMELAAWLRDRAVVAKSGDPAARNILAAFKKRYPDVNRMTWSRWRKKVEAARVEWDQRTSIHVGMTLLRALVDTSPEHFSIETRKLRGGRTQLYLGLSEATQEAMMDRKMRREFGLPHYLPMRIPPIPWRYRPSLDTDTLEGNTDTNNSTTLHTRSLESNHASLHLSPGQHDLLSDRTVPPHRGRGQCVEAPEGCSQAAGAEGHGQAALPNSAPTLSTRSLEGGYLIHKVPLIRVSGNEHTTALAGSVSQADLDAVNSVQATPWRINQFILDTMLEAERRNVQLAGLDVGRQPVVMPPRLSDAEFALLNGDQKRSYMQKREKVYAERARVKSRTLAVADCLAVAEEYRNEPAFWYPMVKDFRHRIYSAATRGPQPQGDDIGKSLIMFAEGKPLGDTGEFWLCVRAANCFGKDKLTLEERVEWALKSSSEIVCAATSPFQSSWWTTAEEPWSFLATCHELTMAWTCPAGSPQFVSHLPCPMDGSCNGIQHLSAMGLDPIGATATNLRPGPRQDIYQTVADVVVGFVDRDVSAGTLGSRMWLGQVDRKTVKRAVMTTPYGVTQRGIRDQLLADNLVPSDASADYMRDCIRDALGSTIVAAKDVMAWLQLCAQRLAKAGLPLRWETPSGSKVEQGYFEDTAERVETMCGKVLIHKENRKGGLKAHKQALASAPNVIHSFDAAHLSMTVNAGADRGIAAWAMVHDSFGTHAGSSQVLAAVLREQFVRIYRENWLEKLWAGFKAYAPNVAIPDPPLRGSFDIEEVHGSAFFFS